jgi:hypothetical protein
MLLLLRGSKLVAEDIADSEGIRGIEAAEGLRVFGGGRGGVVIGREITDAGPIEGVFGDGEAATAGYDGSPTHGCHRAMELGLGLGLGLGLDQNRAEQRKSRAKRNRAKCPTKTRRGLKIFSYIKHN